MVDAVSDPELWTFCSAERAPDLSGFQVEAIDGEVGSVDEASDDLGSNVLVLDTSRWIRGQRRVVPAGTIATIDLDRRRICLRLTKEQVKVAPRFDGG